jgi:hypothetical protein
LNQITRKGRFKLHADSSYKYRIEPNKAQSAAIADMLADFCRLYNGCLEQPGKPLLQS